MTNLTGLNLITAEQLATVTADLQAAADNARSVTAIQQVGVQLAFAQALTDYRAGFPVGVPPVSARPPLVEQFSAPQYAAGNLVGQRGWVRESGAATLNANGTLTVNSDVTTNAPHGFLAPLRFAEGMFRVLVTDPAGGTTIMWGGEAGPGYHFALWKSGSNLETGWWNCRADNTLADVTSRGSTPVPGAAYWVEIASGPDFSGSGYAVRVWNADATRPDAVTMSVAFDGTTPVLPEGPVRFASLGTPATYGAVMLDTWARRPNPIEAQATLQGAWFDRYEAGQNVVATITSGAELRTTVSGTGGVALLLAIPAGMTSRPVIASRTSAAGGAWSSWTRTQVPGTGVAGGTVRVDPVTGLNTATTYRVELCMIVEENDPLWAQGCGVCVLQLIVGDGGRAVPTVEDNLLLVEEVATSIGAAIVADGHAASGPASQPTQTGTEQSHLHVACDILNAIPYHSGYGGTGIVKPLGSGGIPNAIQNANQFMRGRPRTYRRQPNITIGEHGVNDYGAGVAPSVFIAAYRTFLIDRLARLPGTQIILMRPFLGYYAAEIQALAKEFGLLFIDTTGWLDSTDYASNDAVHPLRAGQIKAGKKLAAWLIANGVPVNGASKVVYPS